MTRRFVALLMLAATACASNRVIPDAELAQIFKEAFLANAYITEYQRSKSDSLDVYREIFDRHGYSAEDLEYTIQGFSRRKSARLSDVVEAAIAMLESEGAYYDREVAVLDTIASVAKREMTRVVYADSLLSMKQLKDSARMRIVIDPLQRGTYRVTARYLVDSADRNVPMRGSVWSERPNGMKRNVYTYTMRRRSESVFERSITADSNTSRLVVNFAELPRNPQKPDVTVRDLKVEFTPEGAIDSFYGRLLDVRVFAARFFGYGDGKFLVEEADETAGSGQEAEQAEDADGAAGSGRNAAKAGDTRAAADAGAADGAAGSGRNAEKAGDTGAAADAGAADETAGSGRNAEKAGDTGAAADAGAADEAAGSGRNAAKAGDTGAAADAADAGDAAGIRAGADAEARRQG